jgi:hypothetical protein
MVPFTHSVASPQFSPVLASVAGNGPFSAHNLHKVNTVESTALTFICPTKIRSFLLENAIELDSIAWNSPHNQYGPCQARGFEFPLCGGLPLPTPTASMTWPSSSIVVDSRTATIHWHAPSASFTGGGRLSAICFPIANIRR